MLKTIAFLALIISFQLQAQTPEQAAIAIGTLGTSAGNSIIQSSDRGFAITGYSSCNVCPSGAYVVKLDTAFNIKWTLNLVGNNDNYGYSIVQTDDGGFAVSGLTDNYGYDGGGIYLFKVNPSGNLLWSKTIQGQKGYSIVKTTDKGFAIAGYTAFCDLCFTNMLISKLDSTGNLKWAEAIGGKNNDTAFSMVQTNDGGYALAGVTDSYGAGGDDAYLVKLDSAGNILWSKTIGGTGDDAAYSVIQTNDGGYALAGATTSFGAGGDDVYVIKLDSAGNLQWTRTLGGTNNDIGKSIVQTNDGGYAIAGITYSSGSGVNDAYLIKLDSAGNLIWSNAMLGGAATASSVIQTKSGGYAVTGTESFFGPGANNVYVLMLDTGGNACIPMDINLGITSIDSGSIDTGGIVSSYTPIVSIDTSITDTGGTVASICSSIKPAGIINGLQVENKIELFPNPTLVNLTLQFAAPLYLPLKGDSYVRITDITGKEVYNSTFTIHNSQFTIDVSLLSPGMYIVEVNNGAQTFYGKFVKL
ncbi:MAG: T9SS type A sorting domain-containing protein [Bacteroidia bacterium]